MTFYFFGGICMKLKPAKGMKDYLPREVEIREKMQSTILSTYTKYGFQRIETPIVEDIDNLNKSDGGDNIGLIFKIMKRGEKLLRAENNLQELSDCGLRYDLTLPLSRYFANNNSQLIMPYKYIQIGRVYRAERPQEGRLREFIQCDIDVLGDNSVNAEIELIYVTIKALVNLKIEDIVVKINDRRILNDILMYCGFSEDQYQQVLISIDKLSKIGIQGVADELKSSLSCIESIDKLMYFIGDGNVISKINDIIKNKETINNITRIITSIQELTGRKDIIKYDISLVRGQGYYTGTVFEIQSKEQSYSIAGGGRYDHLIERFMNNQSIPAVGFSIGFERIYSILKARESHNVNERIAIIYYCDLNYAIKFSEGIKENVSLIKADKKVSSMINRISDYYQSIVLLNKDYSFKRIK